MAESPRNDRLPTPDDLLRARERLRSRVHRTPLLSSQWFGNAAGAVVLLKCENLQRSGSFKFRGALNACLAAQEAGRIGPSGVLTYSSGNHGQAVALAARLLGIPATIVVPETTPAVKRDAIEGYGATVVVCGRTSEERKEEAYRIRERTGAHIVPPFDDPFVIAGQSTACIEILEDAPEVTMVVTPVGGGGLLAGTALAAAARNHRVRVVGVEPDSANSMYLSLERRTMTRLAQPPQTIADGLCPMAPGELTLAAAIRHVERVLLVGDDALRRAQHALLERAKLLVEPSGAAGAAALLSHAAVFRGQTVAVVLSGGNTPVPSLA